MAVSPSPGGDQCANLTGVQIYRMKGTSANVLRYQTFGIGRR